MPKMKILDSKEEKSFDAPPIFSSAERKRFLSYTERIRTYANNIRSPAKKVCFLLSVSYFRATQKFFPGKFEKKDIDYLCEKLQIDFKKVDITAYDRPTIHTHRKVILEYFGCCSFDRKAADCLIDEMMPMIISHVKPKEIFVALIEYLRRHHIEIPSYHALSNIIIVEIQKHKNDLIATIEKHLSEEKRRMLDTLMEKIVDEESATVMNRYRLTWLKKSSQSLRPGKIHNNIEDLMMLQELYLQIEHIVKMLQLTSDGIRFFANSVVKFNYLQVEQKSDEDRYLHLITFIVHQYFRLQDTLLDVFLQSHQNIINNAMRQEKERIFNDWDKRKKNIMAVADHLTHDCKTFDNMESIILNASMSEKDKLELLKNLVFEEKERRKLISDDLISVNMTKQETKEAIFYEVLKKNSRTLQSRLSDIVKQVVFNTTDSDTNLIEAINYYKQKDGKLNGSDVPLSCFYPHERVMLYDEKETFDISL